MEMGRPRRKTRRWKMDTHSYHLAGAIRQAQTRQTVCPLGRRHCRGCWYTVDSMDDRMA
ncbi:hypothetical protein JYU34_013271 [Plutella xylostella]|uniref:Uncharacterized protein n=1 Tax=Plutella xylostella TaxID=51655 RepID=A0ABQ7Q9F7_PLUXY|nr:hypothetical protein JYU34_013271 [Plutella xylostella]